MQIAQYVAVVQLQIELWVAGAPEEQEPVNHPLQNKGHQGHGAPARGPEDQTLKRHGRRLSWKTPD